MAGQSRLGRASSATRPSSSTRPTAGGGARRGGPRGRGGRRHHRGGERLRRPARRRLRPRRRDDARRGRALPRVQIGTFADTTADQVTAITMTNAEEAIGIVRAASAAGIPAAISFTVETDGRLPTGQPLREAIEQVDAATDAAAAYFMVNCAHPDTFRRGAGTGRAVAATAGRPARQRIREEPRRTRRGDRTRRGRSGRSRRPARRAAGPAAGGRPCSAAAAAPTRATWRRSVSAWRTN